MTMVDGAPLRAGFWRRIGALLVDSMVVLLPLQILVAILFAQTNGAVQGNFGFVSTICAPLSSIPAGLQPPPPTDVNSVSECRSSLFGFETSRALTVGTVVQKDNVTSGRYMTYALDADGKPTTPFDVTWLALLVLLIYLIFLESRSGATVGKRLLGMRVIDPANPARVGIPLGKAVIRNLAMWIGAIPALLMMIMILFLSTDPLGAMSGSGFWLAFTAAALIEIAWFIWIIVSVSKKRDPIYDRIAGTSVLRTS